MEFKHFPLSYAVIIAFLVVKTTAYSTEIAAGREECFKVSVPEEGRTIAGNFEVSG